MRTKVEGLAGGGRWVRQWGRSRATSPHFIASSLGLAGDGIHDGILRVHADWGVVLGMDDGGFATGTLDFNGLVGGQG